MLADPQFYPRRGRLLTVLGGLGGEGDTSNALPKRKIGTKGPVHTRAWITWELRVGEGGPQGKGKGCFGWEDPRCPSSSSSLGEVTMFPDVGHQDL